MNSKFKILSEIIRNRRAVYPQSYKPAKIDDSIIDELLENARWAPTHKKTQPWRFVVIKKENLQDLSLFLSEYYKQTTQADSYNEVKYLKAGEKAVQSACVIAICIQRSPESVIPSWEETAAVACSVQNLWLSASSLGIGAYWSSPEAIKGMSQFLKLTEDQECLGLFYMGWMKDDLNLKSERKPLNEIVSIFE